MAKEPKRYRIQEEFLKALLKRLNEMAVIPDDLYDEQAILDTFENEEWEIT